MRRITLQILLMVAAAFFISQFVPRYVNESEKEKIAAGEFSEFAVPEKTPAPDEKGETAATLTPKAQDKFVVQPSPQAATSPQPSARRAPVLTPTPAPSPQSIQPSEPALSDQEIYSRYSPAVIQIYCQSAQEIFSASGVILNERGLVLTNAHVAEIIKKTGEANCQARHGNPADPFAKIKVIFEANTGLKIAGTEVPQRDVAFLKIYDAVKNFAAAEISEINAGEGETLLTLGYPSEFLQGVNVSVNSNLVFSVLRVEGFADIDGDKTTADGYVFRGGLALQQGSSGTALFKRSGKIVGIMFATTKEKTTAERQGVALSLQYVDKIMRLETGQGLGEFIAAN